MLSFASRHCRAVLTTAWLPCRSFALLAGKPLKAEELRSLVDEARRPRKRGRPPKQVPTCWEQSNEALAASHVTTCGAPEVPDYPTILRRKLGKLFNDAQRRSWAKGIRSDLDKESLFQLLVEQKGMCAYSGVDLELVGPRSDWLISLERQDNKQGYLRHNVALVAHEFNSMVSISKKATFQGSSQWSKQKVEQLRLVRGMNVDLENLRRQIDFAKGSETLCGNRHEFCTEDAPTPEPGTLKCSLCGIWKPVCQFSRRRTNTRNFSCHCAECRGKCTGMRVIKTVRRSVQIMIDNARGRHNRGGWQGDFELGLDDVLGMLWAQQGRCFYSGVPLRYGECNVDWPMSLERLDNAKTYTRKNTCLVALEFNTRAQWSREKVQFVWGNMLGDEDIPAFPKLPPGFPSSCHFPVSEQVPIDVPSIA